MNKLFIVLIALAPALAAAQSFPSKPLRLIVGFPAGGPADLFGRSLVHVPCKGAAPALPEVATTTEMGYPNVNSDNWYGLLTAAATPPEVQRRLHAAAVAALKSKAVDEQFAKVGGIASPGTPQEYQRFIASEQAKWSKIVQAIGFKE